MEGPKRVVQGFPGNGNEIGTAFLENRFGLLRSQNQAHGLSGNFGFLPDALGIRHLKSRGRNFPCSSRSTIDSSRGAIHNIHAKGFQLLGQHHGVVNQPAAFHSVCRRNAEKQRQFFWPNRPNRFGHFKREPHPVLQRTPVLVSSVIGEWREKAVNQVAVGAMNFCNLKPDGVSVFCSIRKILHEFLNILLREFLGKQPALVSGFWTGRNNFPRMFPPLEVRLIERPIAMPRTLHARLASGMSDLDCRHSPVVFNERNGALEGTGVIH